MGTLKPGSHHEVLRSVCPRHCGPGPPRRRRGCGGSPRLRTSLWRCCWVCSALPRPADDAAAVAPLVYGLPYGAAAGYALPYAAPHIAYAHAPVVYNPLESGLVYPVAEAYVHDATGDE